MIPAPSKEDLEKGRLLHDQIKNHIFRKSPELYLLDEYTELFQKVFRLFSQYNYLDDCQPGMANGNYKYYRWVRDRWLHFKDSREADGYFHYNDAAEIYSNPTIAILNYAFHDFNDLTSKLKIHWTRNNFTMYSSEIDKKIFGRFLEYSEKVLLLLHRLIDEDLVTEYSFPSANVGKDDPVIYKMVHNPLYDNDWTLEKYLHKIWYEDKGYVDE